MRLSTGAADLLGELAAAACRRLDRTAYEIVEPGRLQSMQCRLRGATLGGYFGAQSCEITVAGLREKSRAMQRRDRQASRCVRSKPEVHAGLCHRLREQKKVGGTAARKGRHHIERILCC